MCMGLRGTTCGSEISLTFMQKKKNEMALIREKVKEEGNRQ